MSNRNKRKRQKRGSEKINILHNNVNSWGANAQNTLLSNTENNWDILTAVETHKLRNNDLRSSLGPAGRRTIANPAEPSTKSDTGTHGGEVIAPKCNLNCKPIPPDLLEEIPKQTYTPIRFAAATLALKKLTILLSSHTSGMESNCQKEILSF